MDHSILPFLRQRAKNNLMQLRNRGMRRASVELNLCAPALLVELDKCGRYLFSGSGYSGSVNTKSHHVTSVELLVQDGRRRDFFRGNHLECRCSEMLQVRDVSDEFDDCNSHFSGIQRVNRHFYQSVFCFISSTFYPIPSKKLGPPQIEMLLRILRVLKTYSVEITNRVFKLHTYLFDSYPKRPHRSQLREQLSFRHELSRGVGLVPHQPNCRDDRGYRAYGLNPSGPGRGIHPNPVVLLYQSSYQQMEIGCKAHSEKSPAKQLNVSHFPSSKVEGILT